MTASPDPHVGLPSEETIARAMLDTGLNIGASTWPDEQFRDAQEIARAILSLIRPAFEAREREAHVLRAGLNREREAHRETIRQMAAINEAAESNLAQAVEALDAEIAELKANDKRSLVCMGVGNGGGRLFVYGDYESIMAAKERMS